MPIFKQAFILNNKQIDTAFLIENVWNTPAIQNFYVVLSPITVDTAFDSDIRKDGVAYALDCKASKHFFDRRSVLIRFLAFGK